MVKSKETLRKLILINVALMVIVNTIIYFYLPQPLYYHINGEGGTITALEYFGGNSVWWLAVPALSCLVFILSIRFGWLSIISAFLSLSFGFAASPGLIDRPEPALGGTAIYILSIIAIMLCGLRFVLFINCLDTKVST